MKKNSFSGLKFFLCLLLPAVMIGCQKELPENFPASPPGTVDTTGNGGGSDNTDTTDHQDEDNTYFIRFVVNDVEKEYRTYTKVSFPEYVLEGIRLYSCQVEGQRDLNGTINTIYLTLNDSVPVNVGRSYNDDAFSIPYGAIINYNDAFGNIFSSAEAVPNSKVQISLSAITPTYVSGTFSGKVANVIDSTYGIYPDSAIITNGIFKAKRY